GGAAPAPVVRPPPRTMTSQFESAASRADQPVAGSSATSRCGANVPVLSASALSDATPRLSRNVGLRVRGDRTDPPRRRSVASSCSPTNGAVMPDDADACEAGAEAAADVAGAG